MMQDALKKIRGAHWLSSDAVIRQLWPDFFCLKGDRLTADDPALTVGFGQFAGQTCLVAGVNRGQTLAQRQTYRGGAVAPTGYRKFSRGLKLAMKRQWPVITLINMPGADASLAAEEQGQSQAIAEAIQLMGQLTVPNIAVFIGEGESGGALALANSNVILMYTHSLFSVASPEAMQAILKHQVGEVDQLLPITAQALHQQGLVDAVLPDTDATTMVTALQQQLQQSLQLLSGQTPQQLRQQRLRKFQQLQTLF